VDEREAEELAAFVGVDLATFHERFVRLLGDGALSLVEKPNHDCVFWSAEHGCTVYPVRPRQCRTWPFWRANLATPRHWAAAAHGCPGIGQGTLHPRDEIERALADDGTSGIVPER
jgi:Fe-S-cluster containining protein